MNCINCNTEYQSNFCPNCGQRKDIPRITFLTLTDNFFATVANMDKGFLYNLKHLTIAPHQTIHSFLKGKRRQILNPINYAILTISAYLLLSAFLKEKNPIEINEELSKRIENMSSLERLGFDTGKNLFENLKIYWFLMTFSLSAFTKIIFKRFNYFEHLAINLFVVGHATLLGIVVKAFYHKEIILFNFLVFFYMIFLIYKVFKVKKEKVFSITMATICVILAYIVFFTVPILNIIYS